jgi:hypothetical protein
LFTKAILNSAVSAGAQCAGLPDIDSILKGLMGLGQAGYLGKKIRYYDLMPVRPDLDLINGDSLTKEVSCAGT